MNKRSNLICVLICTLALAGCGKSNSGNESEQIDPVADSQVDTGAALVTQYVKAHNYPAAETALENLERTENKVSPANQQKIANLRTMLNNAGK